MTEGPSSKAAEGLTFAPATVPSSSSSGDEGCTHARRRWSVDGGQNDVPAHSVDSSSFSPTFDIPSNDTRIATIVTVSSTPPSPARKVNLDVNAMFQCSDLSDTVSDARLEEEGSAEASAAAAETPPDDTYSDLSASLSALSKISLPSIADELIAWANQSKESDGRTVFATADLVFKKAIDNAAKSELYAQLCYIVMEHFEPDRHDAQMQNVDDDLAPRPQVFRRRLLNLCQDQFERGLGEEGDSSPDASQQFVGVIKFIGELFNAKVLTRKMVYESIQTLLTHLESAEEPGQCIDGLEVLLTTAGRNLDSRKARDHMDVYFAEIQVFSQSSAATPVHQRKLQALIELRRSWKIPQVAHLPTVVDDSIWGHPLGEMNIPSHSRSQRTSHADSYDPWQSTETKPVAVPLGTGELPPAPLMSEPEATLHAEKNSTDFLSARDVAVGERYFERFPSGHLHLLVHALVEKAILFDADAALVAALFERVAAGNLCPPTAFEDGFTPTATHLAGMLKDVPDALESYARMFKGAGLGADEERCMRIAGMSADSDDLLLLLFSPTVSTDWELVPPSESASPNDLESATAAPLPTPSSGRSEVTDEEVPSLNPAPPYNVDSVVSGRQSSGDDDDDDDLYADFTDSVNRTIPSSHTTPAPAVSQQRRADRHAPTTQPISTQALHTTDHIHVEERIPEPPTPPMSDSPNLPLVRLRMSQKETNARIEQTFAQLFSGPHDIDSALSVFAAVPARYHGRLVDRLVSFATESTLTDAQLVSYFFYCAAAQGLCTRAAFEAGFAVTATALEDVAVENPEAVLLFATMARGAGLHKDADWWRRVFDRLERLGYGRDLASLSPAV
ncbi:hypothetical protein GSI_04166 [Ganoderma sinense ZZ0214-1]|uniref:MIF4G domain-containing protein n=1 Tax=Ganoderma sinense ZZ0214-1 TaxID=1077348 RepID=A0A2G8SIE7_9APHY|nr:hypothetical protein GSI_04166 [Ganoderma sinense ZZ0214-1]